MESEKKSFFRLSRWSEPYEEGAIYLWNTVLFMHVIEFFLFGMLMDCGVVSTPGMIYCLTVVIYLLIRFVIAHFNGYPILTKAQAAAFMLLPLWGPVIAIFLYYLGIYLRFGEWCL